MIFFLYHSEARVGVKLEAIKSHHYQKAHLKVKLEVYE